MEDAWICGQSKDRLWIEENLWYEKEADDEYFEQADDSVTGMEFREFVKRKKVLRFNGHDEWWPHSVIVTTVSDSTHWILLKNKSCICIFRSVHSGKFTVLQGYHYRRWDRVLYRADYVTSCYLISLVISSHSIMREVNDLLLSFIVNSRGRQAGRSF